MAKNAAFRPGLFLEWIFIFRARRRIEAAFRLSGNGDYVLISLQRS